MGKKNKTTHTNWIFQIYTSIFRSQCYLIDENAFISFVFFLCRNEDVDEGLVVNQEGVGLRLTAMQYWKCSKAGISLPFVDKKEPDCKFVIAESLPQQGKIASTPYFKPFCLFHVLWCTHHVLLHILRLQPGGHLLGAA